MQRKELVAEWLPDVNPGKYLAIATIRYDDQVLTIEKEFNVGQMLLEIKELKVNNFALGEIAKFEALVENRWSEQLEDIYLTLIKN